MPDPEKVNQVVAEWGRKAEEDWKTAERLLAFGREAPLETVCFHIQQCVEKYLKAVLVLRLVDFPKTHAISELLALIPDELPFRIPYAQQQRLHSYATVMRYPGDYEPATAREAQQALQLCRKVRKWRAAFCPKRS